MPGMSGLKLVMTMNALDSLLSADQASSWLSLSKSTLAKMRLRGDGPNYIRLGLRRVAYRKQDLEDWVNTNRFRSTSQYQS